MLLPYGAFAVTEGEVIDFLKADPSFLTRHPELLENAFKYEKLSREKYAQDLAGALSVEGTPNYLAGCKLIKGTAGLKMLLESWVDCIGGTSD